MLLRIFASKVTIIEMTKLSVNVNKIATLRNARGGNVPDLIKTVKDIESFGAQGITIHPRPDERHIRYQDARDLKGVVKTELNIEGNPVEKFINLVLEVQPDQVTLVPDSVDAITSNAGWDTIKNRLFLKEVIAEFKSNGIRTSIFVDPVAEMIEGAKETGTERIELYTEAYANAYHQGEGESVSSDYRKAAAKAQEIGLGVNAGHDLDLHNLGLFLQIPYILEVSIGHALVVESFDHGLKETITRYLTIIQEAARHSG